MQPVQGDQNAVGLVVEDERNDQTRVGADTEPAETVLIKTRAVEIHLQALRSPCTQRSAGDRVSHGDSLSDQTRRPTSGCRGNHELAAVLGSRPPRS